ncbi:bifunctional 4-hydroxy-2-oxoglutarate aldolase/2-dehydro-3-deoxy-phosphogluconate aldolase [Arthrobacter subterraneus]|uniref:bifunctional 4-hydroxy-2-oxoglutarate aldolase/2-dehydro-3-deoxy-phosphogluconate aldolase n=1 Tax=Arthrobacter subterraneus TaxID=335973 RepID=UPI0037F7727C
MTATHEWFDTTFAGVRVMAILRGYTPERSVQLAERAWDLGIESVEVPIQSPAALEALAATVEAGRRRDKFVGAGTVVTPEHVAQAAANGAAFTVAPGLDEMVVRACAEASLPHLPGVATATELQRAVRLGLRWVKAFPASVLGVDWFRTLQGPFPEVKFVATGGMNASNARSYLAAGVSVVAVGSALEDPKQLDALSELTGPARDLA